MTDTFNILTVVLEKETREDDAEPILNAIRMIKGVRSVRGKISDPTEFMAQERAKHELREKIWEALHPKRKE